MVCIMLSNDDTAIPNRNAEARCSRTRIDQAHSVAKVLFAARDLRRPNPKLNCKISLHHPRRRARVCACEYRCGQQRGSIWPRLRHSSQEKAISATTFFVLNPNRVRAWRDKSRELAERHPLTATTPAVVEEFRSGRGKNIVGIE